MPVFHDFPAQFRWKKWRARKLFSLCSETTERMIREHACIQPSGMGCRQDVRDCVQHLRCPSGMSRLLMDLAQLPVKA